MRLPYFKEYNPRLKIDQPHSTALDSTENQPPLFENSYHLVNSYLCQFFVGFAYNRWRIIRRKKRKFCMATYMLKIEIFFHKFYLNIFSFFLSLWNWTLFLPSLNAFVTFRAIFNVSFFPNIKMIHKHWYFSIRMKRGREVEK